LLHRHAVRATLALAIAEVENEARVEPVEFDEAIPDEMRDELLEANKIIQLSDHHSEEARLRRKAQNRRARGG
jgi:hypothetical protein